MFHLVDAASWFDPTAPTVPCARLLYYRCLMAERGLFTMVYGSAQLRSPLMSSRWRLDGADGEIATLRRLGRLHISRLYLPGGEEAVLVPEERSVVTALDDAGDELARITRTSWFVSDPRPRRWQITVGGTPVAQITGSLVSYNRVDIEAPLGVPVLVVALAWHVIARPWEAAAAPSTLVASPASEDLG